VKRRGWRKKHRAGRDPLGVYTALAATVAAIGTVADYLRGRKRDAGRDARHYYPRHLKRHLRQRVSAKIRLLVHEGYPPKQAAAIAYRMLVSPRRRHGR
jgi:hypothetical protein